MLVCILLCLSDVDICLKKKEEKKRRKLVSISDTVTGPDRAIACNPFYLRCFFYRPSNKSLEDGGHLQAVQKLSIEGRFCGRQITKQVIGSDQHRPGYSFRPESQQQMHSSARKRDRIEVFKLLL